MKKYIVLLLLLATYIGCRCQGLEADSCFMDVAATLDYKDVQINDDEVIEIDEVKADSIISSPVVFNYKNTKYWGRYTALRAAGWACFGVGIGCCVGGYALMFAAMTTTNDDWSRVVGPVGGYMFFSSPLLVAASIPLLACAYYNRYKAKHLKLDVGVSCIQPGKFAPCRVSTPALNFALNF